MDSKTTTLFGGVTLTIGLSDGTNQEVTVKQLPLAEYDKAFVAQDDEFAMAAIFVGKDKNWILSLTPESYEVIVSKINEVNEKGFFSYAARRMVKQIEMMRQMAANIPADKLEALSRAGLASQTQSQNRRPMPV